MDDKTSCNRFGKELQKKWGENFPLSALIETTWKTFKGEKNLACFDKQNHNIEIPLL